MSKATLARILREPYVHFLVAGAFVLGVQALFGREARGDDPSGHIVFDASDVTRLGGLFRERVGREPTPEELEGIVEDAVRDEVLYREALALGLDEGDTIVRRRLVQKMEFLARGRTIVDDPTDAELEAHLEAHADRYREPTRISFTHVFFGRDARGDAARTDAEALLADLAERDPVPERLPSEGDPFPLARDFASRSRQDVAGLFGDAFADAALALPTGRWSGPVESSFGFHLVLVKRRLDTHVPPLAAIRERLHEDVVAARIAETDEREYERMRAGYTVDVDVRLPREQREPSPR